MLDSGDSAHSMQGAQLEALATEVLALREQSLTHVKERVALKSILDDKVRSLIGDVGQSLAELPIEVRTAPVLARELLLQPLLACCTLQHHARVHAAQLLTQSCMRTAGACPAGPRLLFRFGH